MNILFSETESSITIEAITNVEQQLSLIFPQDYKEHLLVHNGGRCEPNSFTFHTGKMEDESRIDWFLAIYDGKYDNLSTYISIYKIDKKRLPEWIVPIAHDDGGNLICISCGDIDNGYVYFWDHEKEVDYYTEPDTNYSNLYILAQSFNNFLESLY